MHQNYVSVIDTIAQSILTSTTPETPLILLGHSFGGIQAIDVVPRLKLRKILGIVLLASPFSPRLYDEVLPTRIRKHCSPHFVHCRKKYRRVQNTESYRNLIVSYDTMLGLLDAISAEAILALLRSDQTCPEATHFASKVFNQDRDYSNRLAALHLPKLAILGKYDVLVPCEVAIEECRHYKFDWKIAEDCGHFPHVDNPAIVCDILDRFVRTQLTNLHPQTLTPPAF